MKCRGTSSLCLPILIFLGGCATGGGAPPGPATGRPPGPALDVADLEVRASLLLLADRLLWEGSTVKRGLAAGPQARRLLALTLGRLADERGIDALEELLLDELPTVRRAAAFSLRRVPSRRSQSALLRALRDSDLQTAQLAAGSLARLGVPLSELGERFDDPTSAEAAAVLVSDLYRFEPGAPLDDLLREQILSHALASSDAHLRGRAAYALGQRPHSGDRPRLGDLTGDDDAWVRTLAARALGAVGMAADLDVLHALAGDPDARVVSAALRAGKQIVDRGQAAAPEDWRSTLLGLMEDSRPAVRTTALRSAASWLLDEQLGQLLERSAREGDIAARTAALEALVEGGDPRAVDAVARATVDPSPFVRAAAARSGSRGLSPELTRQLQTDSVPFVRQSVLEARLREDPADVQALEGLLSDVDGGVRAAGLRWLVNHPVLPVESIAPVLGGPGREVLDLSLLAVEALVARALSEAAERGTIVAVLERLAEARDYLVRRQAVEGLVALGRPAPAVGQVDTRRQIAVYREIVGRTERPRRLEIVTERGALVVELGCADTPLSCLHFLQLASQGFFRGLHFYLVSPGTSADSGDPRSDGWGGPGFRVRDEVADGGFGEGSLTLSRRLPHLAGSRFQLTLEEQPRAEGELTLLGRVVRGREVLDEIRLGDRIVEMKELGP